MKSFLKDLLSDFLVCLQGFFFLLFGRKRSLDSLRGKDKGLPDEHSQDFWNAIVGLISLIIVIIGLSYLLS